MKNDWNDLQLSFDFELDEVADDAGERMISPDEARLISEAARQMFEGNEKPDWFEDYLGLIEKGWPWRVACYIAWAASPKINRWPATLKDLATDVLGLTTPRVVYTWRKKQPGIDTVVAMMQAKPLFEHRRDVLAALVEMASTPDYKTFNDRKLFLEMTGDYIPKSKLELGKSGKSDDLAEKSDEELRRWLSDDEEEGEDGD